MVLREPVPGLRRVRHNANSPKRVEVIVPAGAALDVPAEVADQLSAVDPHFQVEPAALEQGEAPAAKKTKPVRTKPSDK